MKPFLALALIALCSGIVAAQSDNRLILSATPTSEELTMVFLRAHAGKADPFDVLAAVTLRGDRVVPVLDKVILADSLIVSPSSTDDSALVRDFLTIRRPEPWCLKPGVRPPDVAADELALRDRAMRNIRIFALMSLEAIGTRSAYDLLLTYAQSALDANIRGMAINALATTFREDTYIQQAVPGKEILHAFLKNADDTQTVPYLQTSIGELARKGLITWLDYDTGEPQGKSVRLLDGKGADRGSLADFREQWWLANEKALVWDPESKMFIRK
jgi:hypothetical protein